MRALSRWVGSLALAGMLASAATPAMAQRGYGGGYGGGRGYDRGYHRGGGDGFGVFLGVAALVGAVAVIASSAAKDKKAAQARPVDPSTDPSYDGAYDGSVASAPYPDAQVPSVNATTAESAAVDACALAARDEGSQGGAYAEVREITSTRPFDGGFAVDGTVDQRDGYRGQGVQRRFSCEWKDGRVADMVLSRDVVALR